MAYDPMAPFGNGTNQIMNPQIQQMYQPKLYDAFQQTSDLTWVNGIDSARAFQTKPNSTYALFDLNDDIMYIKRTDASNFPTIEKYRYSKEKDEKPSEKYVTIEEFNKFKEEILNGKQFIRNGKQKWNNDRNTANKKYDADVNGKQQPRNDASNAGFSESTT